MFEAPFPPVLQTAFAVSEEFDGPDAVLYSVRLSQYVRPWHKDVCSHSIYLGGRPMLDPPAWETRRSREGYNINITRGAGDHRCPNDYEDLLLRRIYDALTTIAAPHFRDGSQSRDHHELTRIFKVDALTVLPRPFARSVEELVRSLAPDFKVTELSLGAWPRRYTTSEATAVAATAVTYQ